MIEEIIKNCELAISNEKTAKELDIKLEKLQKSPNRRKRESVATAYCAVTSAAAHFRNKAINLFEEFVKKYGIAWEESFRHFTAKQLLEVISKTKSEFDKKYKICKPLS